MKRYHIIYVGQVQGVGFRYTLSILAKRYNLTGYVKNLDNGNVEVEIQGEDVDYFLKESLDNTGFIRVDDYSYKNINIINNEKGFQIRY